MDIFSRFKTTTIHNAYNDKVKVELFPYRPLQTMSEKTWEPLGHCSRQRRWLLQVQDSSWLHRTPHAPPGFIFNHTYHRRLQIDKYCSGYVSSTARLTKERVVRLIFDTHGLIAWHDTVRLDAMFQAVQLPTGVAHLAASLADMERNDFTLHTRNTTGGDMVLNI